MKYYILPVTFVLASACAVSAIAADRFTIKGVVPGVSDSTKIVLIKAEQEKKEKIAEVFTTDGSFVIDGSVKMPSLCELAVMRRNKRGDFGTATSPRIMVENSDINVRFTQPLDSLVSSYTPERLMEVNGSEAHREFVEYIAKCGDAELKSKLAGYRHAEKYFETNDNPDTMAVYKALDDKAKSELRQARREFIAARPAYHISSVLAFQQMLDIFTLPEDEAVNLAATVSVNPDTARVALNNKALDWAKRFALGRTYPDFAINDVKGDARRFADFVEPGKYTFIDFWASWCGPCRSAIPHVRKLSERYADRMNVLSISVDENVAAWTKAMEKEQMPWSQLHANQDQMPDVVNAYCINSIPRLILLDPQGRIVCSTNLPAEIDKYLEENLK
ncbi:MAG: AhpC/TSA family protein [Duncaniella sp.]|nr:AhpC/TSA family protein [Duncaniella sp.]